MLAKSKFAEDDLRAFLAENDKAREAYYSYLVTLTRSAFGRDRVQEQVDAWAAALIVVSTPRDILLEAIVPPMAEGGKLDGILVHGDADLRRYLEYGSVAPMQSLHAYIAYLSGHSADDCPYMVEYLYKTTLRVGFLGMMESGGKDLRERDELYGHYYSLWSAILAKDNTDVGDQSQALQSLNKLSGNGVWWVRLYAAAVMREYPKLRQKEMVEKLANDPNEHVRDMINGFRGEDKGSGVFDVDVTP